MADAMCSRKAATRRALLVAARGGRGRLAAIGAAGCSPSPGIDVASGGWLVASAEAAHQARLRGRRALAMGKGRSAAGARWRHTPRHPGAGLSAVGGGCGRTPFAPGGAGGSAPAGWRLARSARSVPLHGGARRRRQPARCRAGVAAGLERCAGTFAPWTAGLRRKSTPVLPAQRGPAGGSPFPGPVGGTRPADPG